MLPHFDGPWEPPVPSVPHERRTARAARAPVDRVGAEQGRDLPAHRALEWLDMLAETWQNTDVVEEKSDVIHAVYERIVVEGPRFVSARLTPAAYRHGLALALPEAVMARPTGVGRALTAYRIPIEGRDEWISAAQVRSA